MGLFQHKNQQLDKKAADTDEVEQSQHFFDEYFREELRNRGRWHFENVIRDNAALFKKDLDATIERVNGELQKRITSQLDEAISRVGDDLTRHVTERLDAQFSEYATETKKAQDAALASLTGSATELTDQYKAMKETLERSIQEQEDTLKNVLDGNKARVTAMKDAQDEALRSLSRSTQVLREQQEQLRSALEKNIEKQESLMVDTFKENMAQIIEHYLVDALGDQYDLKTQLPSIIQQMEEHKQEIADDMKL